MQERALMESALSSNRIEGIEKDRKGAGTIIFGKPLLHDYDKEVLGYRRAVEMINEQGEDLPVSVDTIRQLHSLACSEMQDKETPSYLEELTALWSRSLQERWVHPLLLMTAFNLDFLCSRPFSEGNGRVSRLLLLLQSCHLGYEAGRYISLERLIAQSRSQYREVLEESSRGWREGSHDPWPYIDYLLFILKTAYNEFESHLDVARTPRGAKTELIEAAVKSFPGEFTLAELEKTCSGTSHDMVRKVLRDLRNAGAVECIGRGPGAKWQKKVHPFPQKMNVRMRASVIERSNR
jgi:hypothetical protein